MMATSEIKVDVLRQRVAKDNSSPHVFYRFRLRHSSPNNGNQSKESDSPPTTLSIATIHHRYSKFREFRTRAIERFPWLALPELPQSFIPSADLPSKDERANRGLKIGTLLYVCANGKNLLESPSGIGGGNGGGAAATTTRKFTASSDELTPLMFLLSELSSSNETNVRFAPPSSETIDASIAGACSSSSFAATSSAAIHDRQFDLSSFAAHLQAWNSAVSFTDSLVSDVENLRASIRDIAGKFYGESYRHLCKFADASKETWTACSGAEAVSAPLEDDDDEEIDDDDDDVDDADEEDEAVSQDENSGNVGPQVPSLPALDDHPVNHPHGLAPPPPRPEQRDQLGSVHVALEPQAPLKQQQEKQEPILRSVTTRWGDGNKKTKITKNNVHPQHPLKHIVAIGAMYSLRSTKSFPAAAEQADLILNFLSGARCMAKRRRDDWERICTILLEEYKNLHPRRSMTSPLAPASPSLPSSAASAAHNPPPKEPSMMFTGCAPSLQANGTLVISAATLLRGLEKNRKYNSEADVLKDIYRTTAVKLEKLFADAFKEFRILFEKMWLTMLEMIHTKFTEKPVKD